MPLIRQAVLLFSLNLLDALWTIFWVRNGIAEEGNQLMAKLLDVGNFPFLFVKIAVGVAAAAVLVKCGNMKLARYGVAVAIAAYLGVMGVHLFTGLTAFGIISQSFLTEFAGVARYLFIVVGF